MPTRDLYDTQMMAMAINAAKTERDTAEERLETLNKLYGDFYSPSDKDMENWQNTVVRPFKDELDRLYGLGMDPIRTAEGRAALARLSRSIPYEDMNKLRQSAKIGQEYEKNKAKLLAENLYDPEYEQFLGRDLKNWDSLKNGVWQYSSPSSAPTLADATESWYNKRQARPLTKEEVEKEQGTYDPNMDYKGYLTSDILANAVENLPAFLNTPYGRYQRSLAKRQLENEAANAIANGNTPKDITEQDINARLAENIAGANKKWYIGPEGEANPFRLDDYKTNNDVRAYARKAAMGGGGRSGGANQTQYDYGYSTQSRFFNEGVANLLGVPVNAIGLALNSGNDVLSTIRNNQGAIINKYVTNKSGKRVVDTQKILKDLSFQKSPQLVANVLQLKQQTDSDKQNSLYSLPKEELQNLISPKHLASRVYGTSVVAGDHSGSTKTARSKYSKYGRNEIKVAPTGHIVTYLSKDGSIKQYAKVNIMAAKHDAQGNPTDSTKDIMYIDLGTVSTQVKDGIVGVNRGPIAIDRNLSTLRDAGFEGVDRSVASNKTQTIIDSYDTLPVE